MKLVPVSAVQEFTGFEDGVETNLFTAATENATEQIIAILDTDLSSAAVVDKFFILPQQSLQVQQGVFRTRLALTRGFISAITAMRWNYKLDDIDTVGTEFTAAEYAVDLSKGEVIITGPDMSNQYIYVSYTAGYTMDGTDDEMFDQTLVPEWLKRATTLQAVIILDSANPKLRMESGADKSVSQLTKTLNAVLNRHLRFFPYAVRPLV